MDVLRELTSQELDCVVIKLHNHLPHGIRDLYFILACQKNYELSKTIPNVDLKILPKFYTYAEASSEIIFAISNVNEKYNCFSAFTYDKDLSFFSRCVKETKLIAWHKQILAVLLQVKQIQPVLDVITDQNLKLVSNEYAKCYWLQKEEALQFRYE